MNILVFILLILLLLLLLLVLILLLFFQWLIGCTLLLLPLGLICLEFKSVLLGASLVVLERSTVEVHVVGASGQYRVRVRQLGHGLHVHGSGSIVAAVGVVSR